MAIILVNRKNEAFSMKDFCNEIVSKAIEEGRGWPRDAVFKIEVRGQRTRIPQFCYAKTMEGIQKHLDRILSRGHEDFHVKTFEWDLGENLVSERTYYAL